MASSLRAAVLALHMLVIYAAKPQGRAYPPASPTRVYVSVSTTSLRQVRAIDSTFLFDATFALAWEATDLLACGPPYTPATEQPTIGNADCWYDAQGSTFYSDKEPYCGPCTQLGQDSQCYNPKSYCDWLDDWHETPPDGFFYLGYTPFFPDLQLVNKIAGTAPPVAYNVHFGVPEWTGLKADDEQIWVVGYATVSGTLLQPQKLQDFPYDVQTTNALIESATWDSSSVVLVPGANAKTAIVPDNEVDGWDTLGGVVSVTPYKYTSLNTTHSRLSLGVTLRRKPDFYINRFVTPLCMVMCMVILGTAFLPLAGPAITPRMAGPFFAYGTTVSFLFVAGQSVPTLPYQTRLDKFFSLCFFVSFGLFLYHCALYLTLERLKKALEETRKQNDGRLAFCCATRPRRRGDSDEQGSPVKSHRAITILAGAAPLPPTAPAPGAAPSGPRASCMFNSLSGFAERSDVCAAAIFFLAFVVATCMILLGPSSPSIAQPDLNPAYAFKG